MAHITTDRPAPPEMDSIDRYVKLVCHQPQARDWMSNESSAAVKPQFVVHPLFGTAADGIDLTQRIIGLIASELWKLRGGNDLLNWLEAERLFEEAMSRKIDAQQTQPMPNPRLHRRARIQGHPDQNHQFASGRAKHARTA